MRCHVPDEEARQHQERDRRDGQHEEHGDEHELGRDRPAGADLELDLRGEGVRQKKGGDRDEGRRPVRRERIGERDRRRHERAADRDRGGDLAAGEPLRPPRPRLLDQPVGFGVASLASPDGERPERRARGCRRRRHRWSDRFHPGSA
jgi:hypothetical protein